MEESKTHENGYHNKSQQQYSHPSQNKGALIEVWRRSLTKWNPFNDKILKPALILAYSYPIPFEIRSNVWFVVSGALDLMRKNRHVFEHLSKTNSKCIDVIEKDLKRTFLDKETNLKYEHKLRRILVAFSNFDPQIGYTQGMNYIAGFILRQYFENTPSIANTMKENDEYEVIHIDNDLISFNHNETQLIEEKTFWTFVTIMNKIGTLFSDRLPGFHKCVECFKKLFNHHGPPELVQHLNELNVYPIMLSSWYHSLFTYPSMNINIGNRIWDVFLAEQLDFSIIIKISYLIVIRHETQLLQMDFVEIIEFCKTNKCFEFNNKDDHDLIYRASKLQLNELYLKAMRHLKYVDMNLHKDTMFDQNHTMNYNKLNVSSSSVHSNSSSSNSFVKLKASSTSDLNNDLLVPATKDTSNASKSWRALLTFGYAK